MIVSCEKCQKRYKFNPQKLKTPKANLKCPNCGNPIRISKLSQGKKRQSVSGYDEKNYEKRLRTLVLNRISEDKSPSSPSKITSGFGKKKLEKKFFSSFINGLWGKMLVLFFLIPGFVLLISSLLSFQQIKSASAVLDGESTALASSLARDKIAGISRSVAAQAGIYLKTHPKLKSDQFVHNPVFRRIAVQRIDRVSSTILYQMPDQNKALRAWAHEDEKMVGKDLREINKSESKPVAEKDFETFVNILMGVRGLKESHGIFYATDESGKLMQKYMVCTPIEGTPYVIAAAALVDEFAQPVRQFKMRMAKKMGTARGVLLIGVLTTIATIGTVVLVYGYRLTRSLKELIHTANRISVGDLKVKVESRRRDELGELAGAIRRLQESSRLCLERIKQQTRV